jgi:S1-C subfamily serine protease
VPGAVSERPCGALVDGDGDVIGINVAYLPPQPAQFVQVDDRKLELVEDLFSELRDHQPGDTVKVTVLRGGDRTTLDVTLGESGAS